MVCGGTHLVWHMQGTNTVCGGGGMGNPIRFGQKRLRERKLQDHWPSSWQEVGWQAW